MKSDREKAEAQARAGRRAALVVVASGVFWIAAMWLGPQLDLTQRVRALFDLIALAGFGLGLWMTYQAWRIGQ